MHVRVYVCHLCISDTPVLSEPLGVQCAFKIHTQHTCTHMYAHKCAHTYAPSSFGPKISARVAAALTSAMVGRLPTRNVLLAKCLSRCVRAA